MLATEWTANALTGVAVRLHTAGLSPRETEAILHLVGIDHSFQAISEKHDCEDTVFWPISTAIGLLSRLGLSSQVDYTDRNLIEKWFHTL